MATEIDAGQVATILGAAATTQIKAKPGKVAKLLVFSVGSGATIDIYDHASANSNQVWSWVTADAKVSLDLQIPCKYGIRVVVTVVTTAPAFVIVWS